MARILFEDGDLAVATATFAPGAAQAPHRDRHSRVTFVLAGALAEETGTGAARLRPGALLFKSRRVTHEDRMSPDGATLLSLVVADDGAFDRALGAACWRPVRNAEGLRAALAVIEAARARKAAGLAAAAAELLASAPTDRTAARTPPPWLQRLKADLEEAGFCAVDIAARAREAGCHPVHASRLFRGAYGRSATDHAQLHAVRRAQERLAGPAPLSEVALGAGFYDQSHMNRVFRRVAGVSPAAYRRLTAG